VNHFTVFPAIDLRQGQVVRLVKGDPKRQTVFGDDPAGMALRWVNAGANWLHLVNLDGAFEVADNQNRAAIRQIMEALGSIQPHPGVQLGGGLRTITDIDQAFSLGISRVILGTAAVKDPGTLQAAIQRYSPEQVAVAMDLAEGRVMLRGWVQAGEIDPLTLCGNLAKAGVAQIIYTDISRDGTGAGLNLAAAAALAQQTGLSVIVSGGVRSLEDVRQAKAYGLSGVIIGRALYDGAISLVEALAC
jgi:phosphoribosylformimino-5-aminoimidazole carboxamide ribotide isomerase